MGVRGTSTKVTYRFEWPLKNFAHFLLKIGRCFQEKVRDATIADLLRHTCFNVLFPKEREIKNDHFFAGTLRSCFFST